MVTSRGSAGPASGTVTSGICSGRFQIAAASRAIPMWLMQSGRFAVISKSMTGLAPGSTDATSKPRRLISWAMLSALPGTRTRSQSQG